MYNLKTLGVMKKKLTKVLAAVAIIAMASVNVYWVETQQVSDVAAANVAALTRDEGSTGIVIKECYPSSELTNGSTKEAYYICGTSSSGNESSIPIYECQSSDLYKKPTWWLPSKKECYIKVD